MRRLWEVSYVLVSGERERERERERGGGGTVYLFWATMFNHTKILRGVSGCITKLHHVYGKFNFPTALTGSPVGRF